MMTAARSLVCSVAVGLLASACAAGSRTTVRTSIDELAQAENWNKLQQPARGLASAIASGILEGLTAAEHKRVVEGMLDDYVARLLATVSTGIDDQLGPAVVRQVRASVAAAVQEILSESTRRDAAELVTRITGAAVQGVGEAAAQQLRDSMGPAIARVLVSDLGPAIQTVMQDNLGPGLQQMIERNVGPAIQIALEQNIGPGLNNMFRGEQGPALEAAIERASAAASRGIIKGARQELSPELLGLEKKFDVSKQEFKRELAASKRDARSWLFGLLAVGLAVLIGGLLVAAMVRRRTVRLQVEALRLMAQEIHDMGDSPDIVELATRIKNASRDNDAGHLLSDFLRRNPELKLGNRR